MARYMVFDEETSVKETFKRKANPFDKDNWIVARGWKYKGDAQCSWVYYKSPDDMRTMDIPEDVTILVGHNLKFDLLYELCKDNKALLAFFKRGGKIWCTQYAQYLIEGQTQDSQMCSLDSIVEMYGGRMKIDEVKTMWELGVDTPDIPQDLLIDYLVGTEEEKRNSGDIGNTELVFLGQVKRAVQQGQIKMIQDRMDGLISTTFMEFFGLKIDVQTARKNLMELTTELKTLTLRLDGQVKTLPWEFNWGSGVQMSAMLFGGTVKYKVREKYKDDNGEWARSKAHEVHWLLKDGRTTAMPPEQVSPLERATRYVMFSSGKKKGEYKTKKVEVQGELKIKWQDRFYEFAGITEPDEAWQGKQTDAADKPIYSTGKDTIKALEQRVEAGLNIPFLRDFVRKAALDKEIGTYYVSVDKNGKKSGMLTCVQPHDHMLHHKLNHTNTVTTRLSSNDPNLQNLPRGDKSKVKAMFTSRFGADGVMVEADYSQLEVVVQGVLSKDVQLCEDLRNKIDFHCKRVSAQYAISYELAVAMCKDEDHAEHAVWKPRRTKAKNFSFQRAYGAGAKAIAAATGMTVEEVETLIAAEEKLYPGVVKFNADVESAVIASAVQFKSPAEDGAVDAIGKPIWKTYRKGEWYSPTRTRYTWRSHDAPAFLRKKGVLDSFSPPELKNYPVQGTGGEFVQAILGLLIRRFIETDFYNGKAYLVNTVHDCVWIDCHKDVLDQVCQDVKRIMESIPQFYNTRYGMAIDVPFPVEVECGPNMYQLKHWVPGQPAWHHANQNEKDQDMRAA
jgi:DNA polymerase I